MKLSYANVMATIAVFIAIGGSAYAALKVTGKDVVNESLSGKDIKHDSLDLAHLKGHEEVHSLSEAEEASGTSEVISEPESGTRQVEATGVQIILRRGPAQMGAGRIESSVRCKPGEAVLDGMAWYRDLERDPIVNVFTIQNRVQVVGQGREHGRGYVMAIAECVALSGNEVTG
jgi:hypothetical protein